MSESSRFSMWSCGFLIQFLSERLSQNVLDISFINWDNFCSSFSELLSLKGRIFKSKCVWNLHEHLKKYMRNTVHNNGDIWSRIKNVQNVSQNSLLGKAEVSKCLTWMSPVHSLSSLVHYRVLGPQYLQYCCHWDPHFSVLKMVCWGYMPVLYSSFQWTHSYWALRVKQPPVIISSMKRTLLPSVY